MSKSISHLEIMHGNDKDLIRTLFISIPHEFINRQNALFDLLQTSSIVPILFYAPLWKSLKPLSQHQALTQYFLLKDMLVKEELFSLYATFQFHSVHLKSIF